ncbi:EAL domain-containing protein [Rheinheimera sp.]|uniref:EAL domain-containing protein n=1 Tax=Rheinheimera sp. TaxID=1869214 RepID=UPI003AF90819
MTAAWLRCCCFFWLLLAFSASAVTLLQPLTPDQNLSSGSVNDLQLDHQGFLWVATDSGLNRFDGNQNIRIGEANTALWTQRYSKILLDGQKRLWVMAPVGGLYLFNPEQARLDLQSKLPENDQSPALMSGALTEDPETLLLNSSRKVYSYQTEQRQLSLLTQLPESPDNSLYIRTLLAYRDWVFIGTSKGLYLHRPDHPLLKIPHLPAEISGDYPQHVKALSIQQRKLLVGTVQGLYQLDLMQLEQTPGQPPAVQILQSDANIWQILQKNQQLLLGTEQGLLQLDLNTGVLTNLVRFSQSQQALSDNNITAMLLDDLDGLWLGSRFDGAYYWHPRSQAVVQMSQAGDDGLGLSNDKITSVAERGPDELWLGSRNGLNLWHRATGQVQQFLKNPDPKAVWHSSSILNMSTDSDGNLWYFSSSGLNYFDATSLQPKAMPLQNQADKAILQSARVGSLHCTFGAFYLLTPQSYYGYNPLNGKVQELTQLQKAIPAKDIRQILGRWPTAEDWLLLSVNEKLYLANEKTAELVPLYEAPSDQAYRYRAGDKMAVDKNGLVWVSMANLGLLAFDSQSRQLKHLFNTANKLQTNSVYAVQADQQGQIWFSSDKGVSSLNVDNLHVEHFSKQDGLSANGFLPRSSALLSSGELAFGSIRGVNLLSPERLAESRQKPQVVITSVSALQTNLHSPLTSLNGHEFNLPYQNQGLSISFSSLNYRDAAKMRYRFWLDGPQRSVFPEQNQSSVSFGQLAPGDYQFNVIAISPVSGMESEIASLKLTISAAPWLSRGAFIAYGSIALLVLLVYLRTRQQQQKVLRLAHARVTASEQRLKQALDSIDSGAWEWHLHKNSMFASRIHSMLGYQEALNPLTMTQHLSLIHPDDKEPYQQAWQKLLQNPERTFDHSYRMQHKNGQWLWFRDIGKVAEVSPQGQVERVIGTFSNMTETRANQEKARLFGEAFQQTRDWVVILDASQKVMAANQSFADVFGSVDDYLAKPRTHHLGINLQRRRFYTQLLRNLTVNQHWQGEELVLTPDGKERPTLINISAIGDGEKVEFYVLVFTDITAQKVAEEELRYLASYDSLTGLPNRTLLMDRIQHGIDQAKRAKKSLALCFIDLDKFKQINDSLGHDVGDQLLQEVAKRLKITLRETDTIARLGGDEFVVLLESYKNQDNISHVARKILQSVGEPMQLGPHTVSVSPSIGIAVYPDDALDATALLKHADVAMYHAKDLGRNNFQFFINEMNEKAHMQLEKETQLRQAFKNREFVNFYQPIVDCRSEAVIGVEVLMRWQSKKGLVPPSDFIPMAEDLRLIVPMTMLQLEQALTDLKQWRQSGLDLYLSVNLSTSHLEHHSLADQTALLLEKYQLPANCLRYEVTESALMRDPEKAITTMLALSDLGIQLSLDDFGTGYSSLKYLKELPIDAIKIDRSFVKDIGIDPDDETIIEAILSMAASLGISCVAEGVETEQQLAFFSTRQCYLIQGYLFAKPMPAQELVDYLSAEQFN